MSETHTASGQATSAAGQTLGFPLLSQAERTDLQAALARLEHGRGLVVRLADLLGGALGSAASLGFAGLGLSGAMQIKLSGIGQAALARAYDVAILGLARPQARVAARGRPLRGAVLLSGAVGGFVGIAGFVPDAMLTTLAIMRAIAAEAAAAGEDLSTEPARRACLEVFALGDAPVFRKEGGESDLSYFTARLLLQGRPVLGLIGEIGGRYGLRLSEKFTAGAVPVLGAVLGAAVNDTFLGHYRDVARAHFTIRRLERRYGAEAVRQAVAAQGRPAQAGGAQA